MIYLNNAATTYPKPQCVLDAHAAALSNPPSGQFRSSGSFLKEDIFTQCRNHLGELLGIHETERIFFSSGATDSFNKILLGLDLQNCPVVTSVTEHNSILRPLYNHTQLLDEQISLVGCDTDGKISLEELEEIFIKNSEKNTNRGICIINHCSNVTGMVQDLDAIGILCRKYGIQFIVDVSQSGGCIPVNADRSGIDILIMTGHKSLYGVQGTGAYYVRSGIRLKPIMYGGTGLDSTKLKYKADEYEYEVGTQNAPGIAALSSGVEYILMRGVEKIAEKERLLMKRIYDRLSEIKEIRIFGSYETNHGPVMSFQVIGLNCSDVAYILETGYGISVRTGLHCAPLIHRAIGSGADGTVRVSVSDLTSMDEIEQFLKAMEEITESVSGDTRGEEVL